MHAGRLVLQARAEGDLWPSHTAPPSCRLDCWYVPHWAAESFMAVLSCSQEAACLVHSHLLQRIQQHLSHALVPVCTHTSMHP